MFEFRQGGKPAKIDADLLDIDWLKVGLFLRCTWWSFRYLLMCVVSGCAAGLGPAAGHKMLSVFGFIIVSFIYCSCIFCSLVNFLLCIWLSAFIRCCQTKCYYRLCCILCIINLNRMVPRLRKYLYKCSLSNKLKLLYFILKRFYSYRRVFIFDDLSEQWDFMTYSGSQRRFASRNLKCFWPHYRHHLLSMHINYSLYDQILKWK